MNGIPLVLFSLILFWLGFGDRSLGFLVALVAHCFVPQGAAAVKLQVTWVSCLSVPGALTKPTANEKSALPSSVSVALCA